MADLVSIVERAIKATNDPEEREALVFLNDLAWRLFTARNRFADIGDRYWNDSQKGLVEVSRKARTWVEKTEFLSAQVQGLADEYARQLILRKEREEKTR